ncbi:MAG TPA: BMP family ABC transporter substrate-binding protein [Inquilinus sp.]
MSMRFSRRSVLAGSAATLATTILPGRVWAAEPLKVGFIYIGPIGDYGWTHGHDLARREIDAHFGDKVKTSYVESVPEGPDAERVLRQLAQAGNELIFTTSFGYMNPTIRAAKSLPKVKFEHATGYQTAPNVSTYNARFHEGRAVCGTIAGHMTKTGVTGYIGSVPIPEVVMGINAYTLSAQKIRPDMKVKVIWVNSWYDPGKESDGAKALIDGGADILCQHTDSPAAIQVAEARGIYAFGQASDMRNFAPKAQLTSIVDNWGPYYVERVQAVLDGSWKTSSIWWGFKHGMVTLAPYNEALPAEVVAAAEKTKADIIAGTLDPFAGPIKNQKGELVVPEGKALSDDEIAKMDWYVEGVEA